MKKKTSKKEEKFVSCISEELRNDPEFRRDIKKFIKASLEVYPLD